MGTISYVVNPAKADRLLHEAGVLLLAWDKPIWSDYWRGRVLSCTQGSYWSL